MSQQAEGRAPQAEGRPIETFFLVDGPGYLYRAYHALPHLSNSKGVPTHATLGITMMLVLQAFVNMSVVLGLLPTKGIPLPLVSNGGSSLLVSLLAVGVLLNISQHVDTETGAA